MEVEQSLHFIQAIEYQQKAYLGFWGGETKLYKGRYNFSDGKAISWLFPGKGRLFELGETVPS